MIYPTNTPYFKSYLRQSIKQIIENNAEQAKKQRSNSGQQHVAGGKAATSAEVNTGGDRGGNGRGSHTTGSSACR